MRAAPALSANAFFFSFFLVGGGKKEGWKEPFDVGGGGDDDVWSVTPAEERRLSNMFQRTAAITQQHAPLFTEECCALPLSSGAADLVD